MTIFDFLNLEFLLTRPSRGVTNGAQCSPDGYQKFLLTRPSRGVTIMIIRHRRFIAISTHTPLAGRDTPYF